MDGSGTIRWRQVAGRDPLSWLADARSGGWQKHVQEGFQRLAEERHLKGNTDGQMVGRALKALENRQGRSVEEKRK